jgi:hypothetical protein
VPEEEQDEANRSYTALVRELRVVQTGVQILSSLLLTIPFTNRFLGVWYVLPAFWHRRRV